MRIKACLNGGRPTPATPAELAAAAAGAVAAGAEALHIHPRDAAGRESLLAADIGAAVAAVRGAGVPVGVSTGLWMTGGDVALRAALVGAWAGLEVRPDFASVNVHEEGFADLVALLGEAGIGVEAGVWAPGEADAVAGLHLERVLIEIVGTPASAAVPAADAVLRRLDEVGYRGPRLLHGEQEACWPLIEHAGRLGLPTRVGLEDTLLRADGTPATDNAELVRDAVAIWTAALPPSGPTG